MSTQIVSVKFAYMVIRNLLLHCAKSVLQLQPDSKQWDIVNNTDFYY